MRATAWTFGSSERVPHPRRALEVSRAELVIFLRGDAIELRDGVLAANESYRRPRRAMYRRFAGSSPRPARPTWFDSLAARKAELGVFPINVLTAEAIIEARAPAHVECHRRSFHDDRQFGRR